MTDADVTVLSERVLSDGWNTVTEARLRQRLPGGGAQEIVREACDHGHAAAVLPHDPDRGTVLLARQLRWPALKAGRPGFVIEAAAGLIEGDEDPARRARIEAEEELGVRLSRVDPAFAGLSCPGTMTERVHGFTARYGAADRTGAGGGVAGEGEAIEVLELPFAEALDMARDGRIDDLKTIALILHLALARPGAPR